MPAINAKESSITKFTVRTSLGGKFLLFKLFFLFQFRKALNF